MFVLCGVWESINSLSKCRLLLTWRHDSLLVLQASVAFCMKRSPCLCLAGHTRAFDESTPEASLCGSKCLGHRERFCHVSCHKLQMLLRYKVMSCLTFESQLHLSQRDYVNPNSTGNYIGCFLQCILHCHSVVVNKRLCLIRQRQILQESHGPSSRRQELWTLYDLQDGPS